MTSEFRHIEGALERAVTQSGRRLVQLEADSPVLLVFLRHAGCPFCREALADIARDRAAIEASGTRIVLVHMDDTPELDRLADHYGLHDVERICDHEQELYRAFGLKRGGLRQLFGLKVFWRALVSGTVFRHGFGFPAADSFQMPGVFLLSGCAVIRRFRHWTAADRPDYAAICGAVRPGVAL